MIQKILVLLLIYLFFFSRNDYSIYSFQKQCLLSSDKQDRFENYNINDIININNFSIPLYKCDNAFNIKEIFFKLSNISYIINYRFNIIQIEYQILFYHKNLTLIIPSDLSLNYNLHLFCHIYQIHSNSSIDSLAYIHLNNYFKCIEFVNIKEEINFGVIIYDSNNSTSCINITQYFFNENIFNYNKCYIQNDKLFRPLFLGNEFYLNQRNITNFKKLYISKPECNTKSNIAKNKDEWKFSNICNHYFCFCHGRSCFYHHLLNHQNITQICKYKFYLSLLYDNQNLYNKTDYLLADFPGDFQSLDDAYPIFEELIKLKKNAYYMTINKIIFSKMNFNEFMNQHIIKGNFIDGDFLEKYFGLLLRLKAVISGAEYFSFNNLFFDIDYITFISLTHGINYFKANLFNSYYGSNTYNKLVISTSDKIISLAKNYGWKDNNLIKICLPKWDKFNMIKNKYIKGKNKSIFFFFTWRQWKENIHEDIKLNSQYFKKIIELLNDKTLSDSLKKNEITIYFCLHHMLNIYKHRIKYENRNIKFIEQNDIFNTIMNSNLLITDFSSIIFEFMYQKKPFIMFIPDSEDPNINKLYNSDYFHLIRDLKEGKIDFMNKYFTINQTVYKIINYIEIDFNIEKEMIEFYQSFNLTCENNTKKFINYLENL